MEIKMGAFSEIKQKTIVQTIRYQPIILNQIDLDWSAAETVVQNEKSV
jgi:hypothetical protein